MFKSGIFQNHQILQNLHNSLVHIFPPALWRELCRGTLCLGPSYKGNSHRAKV